MRSISKRIVKHNLLFVNNDQIFSLNRSFILKAPCTFTVTLLSAGLLAPSLRDNAVLFIAWARCGECASECTSRTASAFPGASLTRETDKKHKRHSGIPGCNARAVLALVAAQLYVRCINARSSSRLFWSRTAGSRTAAHYVIGF